MHEVSLVAALMKTAERAAIESAGGRRIIRLTVGIGEMSCVSSEALRFAFDMLTPGTALEGAEMAIERSPLLCHCQDCDEESALGGAFESCPKCGSENLRLKPPPEVQLRSIEVED